MTDSTPRLKSDDDFEFDVFSARIGAATRLFLMHLDTCADLLSHVSRTQDRIQKSPIEAAAAKRLSSNERREIDKLVDRVIKEVPAMVEDFVESLIPGEDHGSMNFEESGHHPLSQEEQGAVLSFLGTRGLYDEIDARFREYRDDPIAIVYIRSQFLERSRKSPSEILAESLLPGLVSALEQFLSALLRTALSKHPNGLGELPDVPYRELSRLATKDDIERYLIDQKVNSVLKAGPIDWARDIQKWTRIELLDLGADWSAIRESIQRRHVLVHNGGRVDTEYIAKVEPEYRGEEAVGAPLKCSSDYMSTTLESFRVLALVLACRWANHFGKLEPLEVLPDLVQEVYKLERMGRWSAAFAIAETSVGLHVNDKPLDEHLRVNWWLCRQHLGMGSPEMTGEIYAWTPIDSQMKAARFALLNDDLALAKAVREVLGTPMSATDRRDFKDYVIWDAAKRRSSEVRAAFAGKPGSHPKRAKKRRRN